MDNELKKIENRQKEIIRRLEKVEKYMKIARVFTIIKIILILIPVILAIIYLPPFLENFFNNYFQFLEELNLR